MSRRPMLAAAVAALCLLSFGCSSDKEEEGASTTTAASQSGGVTTTAGASETTAPAAGGETTTSTTSGSGGTSGGSGDPCAALTAEEFSTATGIEVTAELDGVTGQCVYKQNEQNVASLSVIPAEGPTGAKSMIENFIQYPPPGADYEEVDAGDRAVVSASEGRVLVAAGDNGYDITSTDTDFKSLPKDKLAALARAAAG
ncbi:MAG: hypothetical protein KatS3mg008_0454 [Acidimicrobiales bacterium]|nr:MAG: hypothetical protein KatS3mg008_0454 [Acidimicrobiales bacterium]